MERKLTAIMAADVVGYSRLMGGDEAGTHGALKALRADFIDPTIAEHHGRIVKLMGDGALVEVYISYLRTKIDRGFRQPLIHTVRGHGYMLDLHHP